MLPEVGSTRRRMQRPVVVLPQPLSPTSPSTSPAWTSNDTPSTARTWPTRRENSPRRIGKCLRRSRTWRSGSATGGLPRHRAHGAGLDLGRTPAARAVVASLELEQRRRLGAALLDRDRA